MNKVQMGRLKSGTNITGQKYGESEVLGLELDREVKERERRREHRNRYNYNRFYYKERKEKKRKKKTLWQRMIFLYSGLEPLNLSDTVHPPNIFFTQFQCILTSQSLVLLFLTYYRHSLFLIDYKLEDIYIKK